MAASRLYAFAATLARAPAVVSFALDDAGADLIERVHDAGGLVMQQITTVRQAQLAVEHGADIIVAQGGEAGGYGGTVSTLTLVPQVVDPVRPVPVVAAGGIADGRGIAAAVTLGAAGVNLGSRFLASAESPVGERWKKALVTHPSQDWIQAGFINAMNPNPGTLGLPDMPTSPAHRVRRTLGGANTRGRDRPGTRARRTQRGRRSRRQRSTTRGRRSERRSHPTRRTCGRDRPRARRRDARSARRGRAVRALAGC